MRVSEGKVFDIPPGAASSLTPVGRRSPPVEELTDAGRSPAPEPPEPPQPPAQRLPAALFVIALAAVLLLALGNVFPWDGDGRSFVDQKFHASAGAVSGVLTGLSPFAIVAGVLLTLPALRRPGPGLVTAGLLLGFGLTGVAKYFAVLGRAAGAAEPRASSVLVFLAVTIAAALLVAVGTVVVRAATQTPDAGGETRSRGSAGRLS